MSETKVERKQLPPLQIGVSEFGSMCLKMMRAWLAPVSLAAVTKSSSRRVKNFPRTTRARSVQPTTDKITTIAK